MAAVAVAAIACAPGLAEQIQGSPGAELVGVPRSDAPSPEEVAEAIDEIPPAEMIVLNYRLAISCASILDAITTLVNVMTLVQDLYWGLFGLVLLVGPICGLIGVRTLNRCWLLVYLLFCFAKIIFEIMLALLIGISSNWSFLWLLLLALIQLWVLKLVGMLWLALGAVSPQSRRELQKRGKEGARMVYW